MHVFRDPASTYRRPISAISWCPDGGSKIAIAYCNLEFQATHPDTSKESYVFNVGKEKKNPNFLEKIRRKIESVYRQMAHVETRERRKTEEKMKWLQYIKAAVEAPLLKFSYFTESYLPKHT